MERPKCTDPGAGTVPFAMERPKCTDPGAETVPFAMERPKCTDPGAETVPFAMERPKCTANPPANRTLRPIVPEVHSEEPGECDRLRVRCSQRSYGSWRRRF